MAISNIKITPEKKIYLNELNEITTSEIKYSTNYNIYAQSFSEFSNNLFYFTPNNSVHADEFIEDLSDETLPAMSIEKAMNNFTPAISYSPQSGLQLRNYSELKHKITIQAQGNMNNISVALAVKHPKVHPVGHSNNGTHALRFTRFYSSNGICQGEGGWLHTGLTNIGPFTISNTGEILDSGKKIDYLQLAHTCGTDYSYNNDAYMHHQYLFIGIQILYKYNSRYSDVWASQLSSTWVAVGNGVYYKVTNGNTYEGTDVPPVIPSTMSIL